MAKKAFLDDWRKAFERDQKQLNDAFGYNNPPPKKPRYYATNQNINSNTIIVNNRQQNAPSSQPVYDPYEAKRRDDIIRARAQHNYTVRMEFLKIFKSMITLKVIVIIALLAAGLTIALPMKHTNIIVEFISCGVMVLLFIALYAYCVAGYRVIMKG